MENEFWKVPRNFILQYDCERKDERMYAQHQVDELFLLLGSLLFLFFSSQYNIILYYTILYYTILYYTILYYTILYYTALYYTILNFTILYYAIICYYPFVLLSNEGSYVATVSSPCHIILHLTSVRTTISLIDSLAASLSLIRF